MSNLWRTIRNWKGNSKSSSDETATQNGLVLLGNPAKSFDLEDVLRAGEPREEDVLGKGMSGTTYKVDLADGTATVVVKMLNGVVLSAKDFRDKVESVGAMEHENLLALRGYCCSKHKKFLLYDYMPRGSLSDLLHGHKGRGRTTLTSEVRLSIALGAARAIEHLHAQRSPAIYHGNIRSSNVLLTPSYKARVSDYGLAHLTRPAPMGGAHPSMVDVYDFGVLLLELLTGKPPTQTLLNKAGRVVDLPTWVLSVRESEFVLDWWPLEYHNFDERMVKLLELAISCASPSSDDRPPMSEVRRKIEELCSPGGPRDGESQPDKVSKGTKETSSSLIPSVKVDRDSQLYQFSKVNKDMYTRKPPDEALEVSERIYLFDCCLTVDGLNEKDHQILIGGVVGKVQQRFPDAFFMVFNFGEQGSQSQISEVLSYTPVMNYPIHHGDCPILAMEMINHFLRCADTWLSLDEHKNMLLTHCERGGWPVLAFMLAALLLYQKKSDKEEETLHLIYKKAPCDFLHLISSLNPLPSQLRYLHYISTSNMNSEWCPPDRALTLDSVILRFIPCLDAEVGCRLIFKIFGQDPHDLIDKTPRVLFSTPERSKDIMHYKQADCKLVKVNIHCPVQGDVVLECMSLRAGLEHEETMFRVMFNTAYLLENVLMLGLDQMDVPWDRQNQYSREFGAKITFSEMISAASLVSVDSSGDEEQKENQLAKGAKKIEAQELQVEGQAVYSALLSRDANSSHEDNEVREWPIQSDTALPTSILLPTLSSQLEASVHPALDISLASSDPACSSLSQDGFPVSFSATLTKKNIEPLQSPNQQLVSSLELSQDAHSVSLDSPGDEEQTEIHIAKRDKKIEAQELQVEDQAVYGVLLSQDANTSHEENEVQEWPIQSNNAFLTSILLPTLPSQLEASVHSALDGSLATSDSASSSLSQDGSLVSFSAMPTKKNNEPLQSPKQHLVSSLEPSQDVHSGANTESVRWEGIAAVTETTTEVTSVSDSASSSAVNNSSVEATAGGVSNSAQFLDMMPPKQKKLHQQEGSPSSTSMSSAYDYDIFLSFRGPDTRSGITNFLYTRLVGAGIHTFKDDEELRVGEEFEPELLKAISQSKIAIPIFSKGYASSKWCLNELVQMVECSKTNGQKIMPIFYNVTPAEVRHQNGSYKEAFLSHEEKFGATVSNWKAALNHVANLSGWVHSKKNRGEGELVDEIVEKVIGKLKTAYLLVTDYLVGVENHVKEIETMICGDSEETRILGIHGMGGVGKTTLAKIIYNRLSSHFKACCFLSNIRGTSKLKGIESLQSQLISDILDKEWSTISNVEDGIKIIKERLCGKKVLVLLDDVDQRTHWDTLIGKPAWFGLGSRIIITSRNRDIVDVPEVYYSYELMCMNFNQSLQLFCKHVYGRDYPPDDYVAFSTEVVKSTGGLPLALEAIGKLLPRRSNDVWDVILKKLKQVPLNEVQRTLKISYDALDDCQRNIFLDIACLFTGFDQRIVLHSWKDSNLFPEEGLEVLQKMSLIKIGKDNKLWMHDQLKGLGRAIARQECGKEREKHTRLWNHEEGSDVVMETKGTKKIEALCRKFDPQLLYDFANEEVERPSNLRFPEVRVFQKNWPSNNSPANLQNTTLTLSKLRLLSWHHFPLKVKITNFSMRNIVILHLGHCPNLMDIQSIEGLANLRILKLIEILLLERLPDLSNLKKLNELHLGHCHNLIDLQSIEGLENLRTLKLIEIRLLKRLPDLSNLKKLIELHLQYCHGLTEIKSFEGLENLMILKLGELPLLERLPNLSNLKKLTQLDLRQCHNLVKVQGRLESLEDLCIQGCGSLDEVLDPVLSFKKLKSLRIHDCEKLHLDRLWALKFEISDRVYGNSTCLILSKIGICVCQLGRQFFLSSIP